MNKPPVKNFYLEIHFVQGIVFFVVVVLHLQLSIRSSSIQLSSIKGQGPKSTIMEFSECRMNSMKTRVFQMDVSEAKEKEEEEAKRAASIDHDVRQ